MSIDTLIREDRTSHPWNQNGSPPDRSVAQRMDALAKANDIRARRAQLKRDLKAGRRSASAILVATPDWADTMKVFDLLVAVPKWGRVKTSKALRVIGISPSKTVGGISPRQLRELLRWLHGR